MSRRKAVEHGLPESYIERDDGPFDCCEER
jgi:hypothetical protein